MALASGSVRVLASPLRNLRLCLKYSAIRNIAPRHLRMARSDIRLISNQSKLNASASASQTVSLQPQQPTEKYSSSISIPLNNKEAQFDSIFLRDACHCSQCVDPSSSQKNFQTSDIPSDIQGVYTGSSTQNGIPVAHICWNSDISWFKPNHESTIPLSLLQRTVAGDKRQHISHFDSSNRQFWSSSRFSAINKFIPYKSFTESDSSLHAGLTQLSTHGLLLLSSVPDTTNTDSSTSILNIVNRIGSVRDSFYGRTWDVRSVPQAINVAYTHQFLGLHMDLCYMDLTPQFQFLHSLRARAPGGESLFSDSFRAAEIIRKENSEMWEALVTVPVTFHYYNDGQSYRQVRTTVELVDQSDFSSAIKNINWSPPFQGPFVAEGTQLRAYLKAAKRFDELISHPDNLFEYRMKEGDCVIFDNRRVLHARRAFDISKGERWLKGAYLDRDVFASRYARLSEIHG